MVSILQTGLVFILIFTLLVFFHELGHFLLAKAFRMRVLEFALGMGRPKWTIFTRNQTEYTLRAFPVGGFVRIAGMEIEDAAESRLTGTEPAPAPNILGVGTRSSEMVRALDRMQLENTNAHALEQEAEEVADIDPDGFNSRPLYQRFLVIFAGPFFSFLLGWVAFCSIGCVFGLADQTRTLVSEPPAKTSIAYAAGIRQGDVFTQLNGKPVYDQDIIPEAIRGSIGKPLTITVQSKDGQIRDVTVVPKADTVPGIDKPIGRIGISIDAQVLTVKRVSLGQSITQGTRLVGRWFLTLTALVRSGAIKDNVGGPVKILEQTHKAAQDGPATTVGLLGQLSLSLGLFNLMPIPILDGGHLLLMGVELVRGGRKLTAEVTGRVLTTGFAILIALFVLIMFKDVTGFFHRG